MSDGPMKEPKTKIPKGLVRWLDGAKKRGGRAVRRAGVLLKNRNVKSWWENTNAIRWGFIVFALFLVAGLTAQMVGLFFKPLHKPIPKKPMAMQTQLPADDFDTIQKRNMFNVEGKIPDPFDQGLLDCMSQAKPSTQKLQLLGSIVMSDDRFSVALLQDEGSGTKYGVKKDELFSDGRYQAMKIERKKLCFQVKATQDFEFVEIPEEGGGMGPSLQYSGGGWVVPKSETSFEVPRSALNEKLSNLNEILQTARAVPYTEGSRQKGFFIQSMEDNSPFKDLGVRTGDIITNVNGVPMDNPGRGLEVFQKFKDMGKIEMDVTRGGKKVTLTFNIN